MNYKSIILCVCFAVAFSSCMKPKSKIVATPDSKTPTRLLNNEIDSVSYSMGVSIGKNIKTQGLDSFNTVVFAKGLEAAMKADTLLISAEKGQTLLTNFFQNLYNKKLEANATTSKRFLEENKAKEGVITTASGLQYKVLKPGEGPMPKSTDKVKVHYHGTLVDGTVFDSSVDRGEPISFGVTGVIPGWTEALQLMKVGSKWKLFIPSDLAYGERGAPPIIGPNSALIFDVELLGIEKE